MKSESIIYHNLTINATSEKVFKAISQPTDLINWWPQKCEGIPKLGERYHFFFTKEYDWYGEVVKYVPNNAFYIKMKIADNDWLPTTFGFDLIKKTAATQVRFFHKDWPSCNDHFKQASYCWALLLFNLKNYVEKGTIIPFEERA